MTRFRREHHGRRDSARIGILLILVSAFLRPAVAQAPAANPPASVVINELHYAADRFGADEFIELYNASSGPVDLSGWSFTRGVALKSTGAWFRKPMSCVPCPTLKASAASRPIRGCSSSMDGL